MGNTCSTKGTKKIEGVEEVDEAPKGCVHTKVFKMRSDEDGRKNVNQYVLLKKIGKGSYGKVIMAMDNENSVRAIKLLDKRVLRKKMKPNGRDSALDDVRREIKIMKDLDHPNVVKLREVIDDEKANYICLIMDYCPNGKLLSIRHILPKEQEKEENEEEESSESSMEEEEPRKPPKRMSLHMIFKVFIETLQGLDYLHKRGVYHSDIKPENLLVDQNENIKISDFGVSLKFDVKDTPTNEIRVRSSYGTPTFQAPEIFGEDAFNPFLCDLWSLAVTLYVLLFFEVPFESEHYQELARLIKTEPIKFPQKKKKEIEWFDDEIEQLTEDFLRKMMEKKAEDRYQNVEEIRKTKWYNKISTYVKESKGNEPQKQHKVSVE